MAKGKNGWGKAVATGGIIATLVGTGSGSIKSQSRSTSKRNADFSSQTERRRRGNTAQGGTTRKGNDTRGSRKKY